MTRVDSMRHYLWVLSCAILISLCFGSAHAVAPDERLADPALEAQARDISKELRCLVCQNQSIDDSDADLARDLRILVRQRLSEGDSPEQVIDYITNLYGEYVLLKPQMGTHTILLWLSPALLLLIGVLLARGLFVEKKAVANSEDTNPETGAETLSETQRTRLDELRDL